MVFAYSAFAKLRSGKAFRRFRTWLADLRVTRRASAVAVAAVAAEVSVVVLAVLPWAVRAGLALAAALLAIFIVGTCLAIARGTTASCECFGTSGGQLGPHHVVRDVGLLAAAVLGAVARNVDGARPAGVAVCVAAAVVIAILVVFLDDWLSLFVPPPVAPGRAG